MGHNKFFYQSESVSKTSQRKIHHVELVDYCKSNKSLGWTLDLYCCFLSDLYLKLMFTTDYYSCTKREKAAKS